MDVYEAIQIDLNWWTVKMVNNEMFKLNAHTASTASSMMMSRGPEPQGFSEAFP